jgi:hypothetical protein
MSRTELRYPMTWLSSVVTLVVVSLVASTGRAEAQSADPLTPYRTERDAFVQTFRIDGRIDSERLVRLAGALDALVQRSTGETRARVPCSGCTMTSGTLSRH